MNSETALLIRDKYNGDDSADISEDLKRLAEGEPLAYVIGWIPFLGLKIFLDSHPLIPRPETEWWAEKLIDHLKYRFGNEPFTLLDLCAGSGAIGLAILKAFPNAHVSFGELVPEHISLIQKNIEVNALDVSRTDVRESDLFNSFAIDEPPTRFNIIATNPPYIPEGRVGDDELLSADVTEFEPAKALFAGADGMQLISKIIPQSKKFLLPDGELWLECDIANADATLNLAQKSDTSEAAVHLDQYGRARLLVAHFE